MVKEAPVNCAHCDQPLQPGDHACLKCGTPIFPPTAISTSRSRGAEPVPGSDIGTVLDGKWRLESKLGEGGMGTVYLAHDEALDREVAVKILARQLSADRELVTRFEREAKMMAKLDHPNIVPVYAVGEFEQRP